MRILRVIRIISFVNKLNIIVEAYGHALASVFWGMSLLVMSIYMFAILSQSSIGSSEELRQKHPKAHNAFSTIPKSMVTLLQLMAFDNLDMVAWEIAPVLPYTWFLFLSYILFVSIGLLALVDGLFVQSILDQTEKHRDQKAKQQRKLRQKFLATVQTLFRTFDEDKGGTLDKEEMAGLIKATTAEATSETLETVGLSVENLHKATEIADYDHSKRLYDPVSKRTYDTNNGPPPDKQGLLRDGTFDEGTFDEDDVDLLTQWERRKGTHALLPEGVTEHDLLDCLLRMGDDVKLADHFAAMKRLRLIDCRLHRVEDSVHKLEGSMAEILRILKQNVK